MFPNIKCAYKTLINQPFHTQNHQFKNKKIIIFSSFHIFILQIVKNVNFNNKFIGTHVTYYDALNC